MKKATIPFLLFLLLANTSIAKDRLTAFLKKTSAGSLGYKTGMGISLEYLLKNKLLGLKANADINYQPKLEAEKGHTYNTGLQGRLYLFFSKSKRRF